MDIKILEETELRANVVEWYEIDKNASILEINSNCPPITECLKKKSDRVRAINNMHMIDEELETKNQYDVIAVFNDIVMLRDTLDTTRWSQRFVRLVREHLTQEGKLLIACNNRFGLQYWSGCKSNDKMDFFAPLMHDDEHNTDAVSMNELQELANQIGGRITEVYYPYPDYRICDRIYSDDYLPKTGELNNNRRNYFGERMLLFDEDKVFDEIIENKLFPVFSNSFFVVIEKKDL